MAKKHRRVGIIAEDVSDVAVIKILIQKILGATISIDKFVGNGCGKIVGKCSAWSRELAATGCKFLFIVHDLDRRRLDDLEMILKKALGASVIRSYLIVIPVKELEAWLLADEIAVRKTFKFAKPMKRVANPESVANPKEALADTVFRLSGKTKRYINTVHNQSIAEKISCASVRRCSSFAKFEKFVNDELT